MVAIPESVIDTLNGLLEAEATSVFRYVVQASPHLGRADAAVREPIAELHRLSERHTRELSDLIQSRGGVPRTRHRAQPEDQYLSFLSLKFLLPKLVTEKDLILTRYENAKATIGPDFPDVIAALERIEGEQRVYLEILAGAASRITGGKFQAPAHQPPER